MEDITVKVIDCLPLKIGYKSLYRILQNENPHVVGVGDSLPYVYEGLKVLRIAKAINPEIITIAGGHFHSHLPRYSLENFPEIDFIVRYEGEEYLKDLLQALRDGSDVSNIKSIAFRNGDRVIETEPGGLIDDLDSLPLPDYHIMPVHKYSPFGKLWPKAATIQGSRGCLMDCDYCSWNALEGEHISQGGKIILKPHRRSKSVARVMEEIDLLYNRYNIRYLFWVDGTWNFDTQWLDSLCSEIMRKGYRLGWWAFVRPDLLMEQEKAGVLEKMVKAGFSHTLFGGERFSEEEMISIGRTGMNGTELLQVSWLLKKKYPEVFRQATFITGIRSETKESMKMLGRYARKTELDFAAFHPIMPYPGTPLWERANREGWIEEKDFSKYDMFHPIMPSENLSRTEISQLTKKLYMDFVNMRPLSYLKGLFSKIPIRRRLHWWFLYSVGRVILRDLFLSLRGGKKFQGFAAINQLWKPKWYDE